MVRTQQLNGYKRKIVYIYRKGRKDRMIMYYENLSRVEKTIFKEIEHNAFDYIGKEHDRKVKENYEYCKKHGLLKEGEK